MRFAIPKHLNKWLKHFTLFTLMFETVRWYHITMHFLECLFFVIFTTFVFLQWHVYCQNRSGELNHCVLIRIEYLLCQKSLYATNMFSNAVFCYYDSNKICNTNIKAPCTQMQEFFFLSSPSLLFSNYIRSLQYPGVALWSIYWRVI